MRSTLAYSAIVAAVAVKTAQGKESCFGWKISVKGSVCCTTEWSCTDKSTNTKKTNADDLASISRGGTNFKANCDDSDVTAADANMSDEGCPDHGKTTGGDVKKDGTEKEAGAEKDGASAITASLGIALATTIAALAY